MRTASPLTLADFQDLSRLRDELRLQSHLFKAEARDLWREAESRWHHLEEEAQTLAQAVDRSSAELSTAATLLGGALKDTYQNLRNALRTH